MMIDRSAADASRPRPHGLTLIAVVITAAAAATYVMHVVSQHTIAVVRDGTLLPRWDLATHLGHGWVDYHFLVTGQILDLLQDLWFQGYWPPGLSIYQMPFYLALGGDMTSGLWSSAVAFVLAAVTGAVLLWRQRRAGGLLAAGIFLALLLSSPFLLAYATVTMTEMFGALGQLLVLLCYVEYRQRPSEPTARLFAVSLTVLFFIKYNYFVLLAGPLVLHEWLERTSGWPAARRLTSLRELSRRVLSSPSAVFVLLYLAVLLIIVSTGGFQFHVAGRRVSVRSVGNTGHVVLYLLLGRLWYLHHRGRIDWRGLTSADLRIRPLLIWFAVPVTLWLASPYPNHIRDFANLVINRPLGEPTVGTGIATYVEALRNDYFYTPWLLAIAVAAFSVAALRYRQQPPMMRWLILAIPLQLAAILLHQTRFPRFLLLTVVLICLAAASEIGRWFADSAVGRIAAGVLAPIVVASSVAAARHVVTEDRFRTVAFENYTRSEPLRAVLDAARHDLNADARLLIVGGTNDLSPALFRWELGPPMGVACFPFPIAGAGRLDPALATHVLLVERPGSDFAPIGVEGYDPARLRAVQDGIDRGELVLRRDMPLADLHAVVRLYARTSSPPRVVECR